MLFDLRHSGAGNKTEMIACPQCGTEKRCDENTRTFRCKNCKFKADFRLLYANIYAEDNPVLRARILG